MGPTAPPMERPSHLTHMARTPDAVPSSGRLVGPTIFTVERTSTLVKAPMTGGTGLLVSGVPGLGVTGPVVVPMITVAT
jgi:hypothetical protein